MKRWWKVTCGHYGGTTYTMLQRGKWRWEAKDALEARGHTVLRVDRVRFPRLRSFLNWPLRVWPARWTP